MRRGANTLHTVEIDRGEHCLSLDFFSFSLFNSLSEAYSFTPSLILSLSQTRPLVVLFLHLPLYLSIHTPNPNRGRERSRMNDERAREFWPTPAQRRPETETNSGAV